MAARKALISYSHRDEAHRLALETALSAAVRAGEIELWSDHKILPGQDFDEVILSQLQAADLVLLLVSPDFIASDYCYKKELQIALERHENKRAVVVPIVVRPTDWKGAQFSKLLMLPHEARAVSIWQDIDEAWLDVSKGIRRLSRELPAESNEHTVFKSKELKSRLRESFALLQTRFEEPERLSGVAFGFQSLDVLSDGAVPGELTLIASRPEQGHIELALSLLYSKTSRSGKDSKFVVISQRSTASNLTNRLLCSLGLVSRSRFARGSLEDEDWSRITGAIRLLKDLDITVDDDLIRSAEDLRIALNQFRDKGVLLVLIDGIEYTNGGGQERDISLVLADFAKKENAAVVVTLALGPELESRANRKPLLPDLGSWHELGDFSSKVLLCHRELKTGWMGPIDPVELDHNVQIQLAKSSDGSQGQVTLRLHGESGSLYDPIPIEDQLKAAGEAEP